MGKAVEGSPAVGPPLGIRTSRFTSRFFGGYRIRVKAPRRGRGTTRERSGCKPVAADFLSATPSGASISVPDGSVVRTIGRPAAAQGA